MKKILSLHGFFASGSCVPAKTIKEALQDKVKVLTPDLPVHPYKALELIRSIIDKEKSDLLVGNSCGTFYAQMLAPIAGVPALLGNPHSIMTVLNEMRIILIV